MESRQWLVVALVVVTGTMLVVPLAIKPGYRRRNGRFDRGIAVGRESLFIVQAEFLRGLNQDIVLVERMFGRSVEFGFIHREGDRVLIAHHWRPTRLGVVPYVATVDLREPAPQLVMRCHPFAFVQGLFGLIFAGFLLFADDVPIGFKVLICGLIIWGELDYDRSERRTLRDFLNLMMRRAMALPERQIATTSQESSIR